MITILLQPLVRDFAENKDIARDIREKTLMPALARADKITIDFAGVNGATQSFIHALISDALRKYGSDVLEHIIFRNCNDTIRVIITIVTEYMQES
ncbi:MAG TPA: DUF4325 domain-containing protein [Ignavibacteria bacterium]|nr:DUF4325 domain-containing protein [Ignavibacteria bacterium]